MTNVLTIGRTGGKRDTETRAARRRARAARPPWEEPPTTAYQAAKGMTLGAMLAVVLVPLWIVVLTSFSTPGAVNRAAAW
ncbi:hypothetical protein ACFQ0T_37735 [Kitasatospora gansuensis]